MLFGAAGALSLAAPAFARAAELCIPHAEDQRARAATEAAIVSDLATAVMGVLVLSSVLTLHGAVRGRSARDESRARFY